LAAGTAAAVATEAEAGMEVEAATEAVHLEEGTRKTTATGRQIVQADEM